jgi:hypothetical protein
MLDGHDLHAQAAATGGYDGPPRSSSQPSEDPVLAWLARLPVGRPLSAKALARIPEAEALAASGAPILSTEELLARARNP